LKRRFNPEFRIYCAKDDSDSMVSFYFCRHFIKDK
jgi:hypothetical protein